jgi:hypothetical protein
VNYNLVNQEQIQILFRKQILMLSSSVLHSIHDKCISPMTIMRLPWTAGFPLAEPTTIFEKKGVVIAHWQIPYFACQIWESSIKNGYPTINVYHENCSITFIKYTWIIKMPCPRNYQWIYANKHWCYFNSSIKELIVLVYNSNRVYTIHHMVTLRAL